MEKNEYAKAVSLFLAELLRTRKITLNRAAEIAQKVVENINLIDTEEHFLKLVHQLSKDFEELFPLEERMHFHVRISERKDLERKVRSFVIKIISSDMHQALSILQEAVRDEVSLTELSSKFPEFKEFVEINSHQWTHNHS